MEKIKKLLFRLLHDRELIRYVIMGALTTLVNFLAYSLLTRVLGLTLLLANTLSWVVAVAFAYVGNKLFVFQSKTETFRALITEIGLFAGMRLASLGLETLLLWLMVDKLSINDLVAKAVCAVIVVISNYIFSKLVIFRKARKQSAQAPSPSAQTKEEP